MCRTIGRSQLIFGIRCPSERNKAFEDQGNTRDATSDHSETTKESHGQDILHSLISSKPLEESPLSQKEGSRSSSFLALFL
ncbi:hypothetical protein LguiA_035895 [Lonicera macranthoides]